MAKATRTTRPKAEAPKSTMPAAQDINNFADELQVDYIKARDLFADSVQFTILDAYSRKNPRFGKDEIVLEIVTADGESGFITLAASPRREKLLKMVKQHGAIGPLIVVEGDDDSQGNKAWCLANPNTPDTKY